MRRHFVLNSGPLLNYRGSQSYKFGIQADKERIFIFPMKTILLNKVAIWEENNDIMSLMTGAIPVHII